MSSVATEATYAACLLECGPHVRGRGAFNQGWPRTHYYHRLYRWYCNHTHTREGHTADWVRFSHDYFDWVEGSHEA